LFASSEEHSYLSAYNLLQVVVDSAGSKAKALLYLFTTESLTPLGRGGGQRFKSLGPTTQLNVKDLF
jgi:hypothetical protein